MSVSNPGRRPLAGSPDPTESSRDPSVDSPSLAGPWRSAPARILGVPIVGYRRVVSPLLGPRCRFEPPCSIYALGALRVHGALKGSWLVVRRLARCQPFHPGGWDPVPPREKAEPQAATSRGVARGYS